MKALLVEDDVYKRDHILDVLRDTGVLSEITQKASVNSALREIRKAEYQLIVLDMSLPTFDISPDEPGGRPQGFGGREILRNLKRLKLNIPTVVITQYEFIETKDEIKNIKQLEKELTQEFEDVFIGIIYYNSTQTDWKSELQGVLKALTK